jgi:tRNA threonylcarbamoyl adenosine modification protein (Sua5/YciO/YrdC/YwlC family)
MSSVAERIQLADAPPPADLSARVAGLLGAGGLVCMPTETVYGIAARADHPAALARLFSLKGRDPREPLTWHVAERAAVRHFAALRPLAERLVERYWPGPLTLVLEGVPAGLERVARDGWTGLRLPAHRGTAGLIATLDFPVVLTSVNKSGEPPLLEAGEILERFGAGLDLVLDGGRSRLGEPSGVLQLGRGVFAQKREGLVSLDELRAAAGLAIGFCCTGNTCRSPMAQGLAELELARRLGVESAGPTGPKGLARFGFRVRSLGLHAASGSPAAENAVLALADQGYDLSRHQSRQATLEELQGLDRIYGLTRAHVDALRAALPPRGAARVALLDPAGESIQDPIGGSLEAYRACMLEIREAIARRAPEWA